MFYIYKNRIHYIVVSLFIFFLDQISKLFIFKNYELITRKNFLIFRIEIVKNYGAAFNLLSGSRILLSFISIFVTILLVYFIFKKNESRSIDLYGYSFILGGSVGNGIDRLLNGYVIDFINLNFINFPIFNIADISINIGFILILFGYFKFKK